MSSIPLGSVHGRNPDNHQSSSLSSTPAIFAQLLPTTTNYTKHTIKASAGNFNPVANTFSRMTFSAPTRRDTSGSCDSSHSTSSSLSTRNKNKKNNTTTTRARASSSLSHDEARSYYYGRHSNKWLFGGFSVRDTVGGAIKTITRKVTG
ncbi:hypothetical protein MN608_01551 [Microdochium nivale]|nr:hypothetical protein MN608_01551 [Microdochium nivale]